MEIKGTEKTIEKEPYLKEQILVAGTTFFPNYSGEKNNSTDNVRGNIVLSDIEDILKENYSVSIIDGGSSRLFKEKLYDLCQVSPRFLGNPSITKKGYALARNLAIQKFLENGSQEIKVIADIELEKGKEIKPYLSKMAERINRGKCDIMIPDRMLRIQRLGDKKDYLAGYPKLQAWFERTQNIEITKDLKKSNLLPEDSEIIDFLGGTRVRRNDPLLNKVIGLGLQFDFLKEGRLNRFIKPDRYGPQYYILPIVLAMNFSIGTIEMPGFCYPEEQLKSEAENFKLQKRRFENLTDIGTCMAIVGKFIKPYLGEINTYEHLEKIMSSFSGDVLAWNPKLKNLYKD